MRRGITAWGPHFGSVSISASQAESRQTANALPCNKKASRASCDEPVARQSLLKAVRSRAITRACAAGRDAVHGKRGGNSSIAAPSLSYSAQRFERLQGRLSVRRPAPRRSRGGVLASEPARINAISGAPVRLSFRICAPRRLLLLRGRMSINKAAGTLWQGRQLHRA